VERFPFKKRSQILAGTKKSGGDLATTAALPAKTA
jgi:hypothetical protein